MQIYKDCYRRTAVVVIIIGATLMGRYILRRWWKHRCHNVSTATCEPFTDRTEYKTSFVKRRHTVVTNVEADSTGTSASDTRMPHEDCSSSWSTEGGLIACCDCEPSTDRIEWYISCVQRQKCNIAIMDYSACDSFTKDTVISSSHANGENMLWPSHPSTDHREWKILTINQPQTITANINSLSETKSFVPHAAIGSHTVQGSSELVCGEPSIDRIEQKLTFIKKQQIIVVKTDLLNYSQSYKNES